MRLLCVIAILPVAACAQQMVSMQASGDTVFITVRIGDTSSTTFSGAPYPARRITTGFQTFPDGSRVPQDLTAVFYRDGAGRNRIERQVALRSPDMVTILDPVLGCEYVLDPGNKIAHRLAGVRTSAMPASRPGLDTQSAADLSTPAARPNGVSVRTEDLGTRTMQGLNVHGTRTTTTRLPGTRQGNDRAVVSVYEAWLAPSLGNVVVASRTVDPDKPELAYALAEVVVGEPDPQLFAPPRDYRIVDESSDFKIAVPRDPASKVTKIATHGLSPATIASAPFSGTRVARGVQILADGTRVGRPDQTTFSAWRDSEGRVRTEWAPRGNYPGDVEIKDPTTGFVYNPDLVNRVAYRSALLPQVSAAAKPIDAGFEVTVTQLGIQVMSGVAANGVRTTTLRKWGGAPPEVSEIWTARTEGVVLVEKSTTANSESTVTLENFSTKEPDPSLFGVSATYRILDEYGNQIQAKQ